MISRIAPYAAAGLMAFSAAIFVHSAAHAAPQAGPMAAPALTITVQQPVSRLATRGDARQAATIQEVHHRGRRYHRRHYGRHRGYRNCRPRFRWVQEWRHRHGWVSYRVRDGFICYHGRRGHRHWR